ncbi:hypothetical protein MicloDRAFT_00019240 [Microvirga lotononidis]|uniref:Uncharacterized protein n=1 Tax=Microvirga lotononidis TaxID=864069 RepID=I4YZQ4_9HYPH|nr:hypothetical protein MicloDRAFT_00019240 [Microvirga lotononidis]
MGSASWAPAASSRFTCAASAHRGMSPGDCGGRRARPVLAERRLRASEAQMRSTIQRCGRTANSERMSGAGGSVVLARTESLLAPFDPNPLAFENCLRELDDVAADDVDALLDAPVGRR